MHGRWHQTQTTPDLQKKTIPKGEKFPAGVVIHCHPKGWMDEDGVILWLNKVWCTRPGGLLKKPCMLVWDQFHGHLTDNVKEKVRNTKTHTAVIPGGLTSVLQPLDVVLNKPFKDHVRQHWITWMGSGSAEKTATGNLKKPGLSVVAKWVKEAWDELPVDMVKGSFLKTGISNAMDGTEDDFLWKEDSDQSDTDDDEGVTDYSGWDHDEKISEEEWIGLFGLSDEDPSDFEGF